MRAMSFMSGRRHLLLYRGNNLFYLDCREADESRLRELCENFLGPPTGMTDAVSFRSQGPEMGSLCAGKTSCTSSSMSSILSDTETLRISP